MAGSELPEYWSPKLDSGLETFQLSRKWHTCEEVRDWDRWESSPFVNCFIFWMKVRGNVLRWL